MRALSGIDPAMIRRGSGTHPAYRWAMPDACRTVAGRQARRSGLLDIADSGFDAADSQVGSNGGNAARPAGRLPDLCRMHAGSWYQKSIHQLDRLKGICETVSNLLLTI
jgi:hypothetical protein